MTAMGTLVPRPKGVGTCSPGSEAPSLIGLMVPGAARVPPPPALMAPAQPDSSTAPQVLPPGWSLDTGPPEPRLLHPTCWHRAAHEAVRSGAVPGAPGRHSPTLHT